MFGRKSKTSTSLAPHLPEQPGQLDESLPELASIWEPPLGQCRFDVEQVLLDRGQISEAQAIRARELAAPHP